MLLFGIPTTRWSKFRYLAVAALLAAAQLTAATYYVATNGNDNNPGSQSQPFRTVQRGVNAAAAGDTIIVRDGRYTGSCSGGSGYAITINKGGTASAPITLKAENKWGATLDGTGCHSSIYLYGGANYWVIEGFIIANASWGGISSNSGAGNITIRRNRIENIGRRNDTSVYGIYGVYTNAASHDFVIDGNVIHDIGRTGGEHLANDHGLYLHSRNTTIVNNIFYRPISGWAIQTASGFGGLIANNTFHGPHPTREGHIMLWDPNYSVTIRNNIFYSPRSQAITSYAFSLYSGSSCSVDNNIVYGSGVALGAPSNCSTASNRLNTNPMLASASAPYDFQLTAGSPAIDTGATIASVRTDAFGTARPQGNGYDVGAVEYAAAVPLSITGVTAANLTSSAATITWTTNIPADSRVDYGVNTLAQSTPVDSRMVTSHSVTLTGLTAFTTYTYRVASKDSSGRTATSQNFTFTTASAPAAFGCSLLASPSAITVQQGSTAKATITATLVSGPAQAVTFSASTPAGVTASFSPSSCIASCSTTLTLSASNSAAAGLRNVTVSASGGQATASATVAVNVTAAAAESAPQVVVKSLVNAAHYGNNLSCSPNALVTLFGENITSGASASGSIPLPRELAGVQVKANGAPLPLLWVSPSQINLQCPDGPPGQRFSMTVERGNQISAAVEVAQEHATPGIFTIDATGEGQGSILIANTDKFAMPVTPGVPSQPAAQGDYISIFATGLGSLTVPVPLGEAAKGAESRVIAPVSVRIGGIASEVTYAGMAPGWVGLYQVNARVPAGAPAGDAVPVVISVTRPDGSAVTSNTVTIAIRR